MNDPALNPLESHHLARLLDPDAPAPWSPDDAAAALRHQLAAPLLPDLAQCPAIDLAHLHLSPQMTFLQALTQPAPPLSILMAIKLWARQLREDLASPLSGSPATVLYYAAIAAAHVRLAQRLTTLSDAQLREGCAWARTVPGAEALAQLFDHTLAAL